MSAHPSMTKSPVTLAKIAFQIAQKALLPWSCPKSRHDFTQQQLFAILVLKQFMQTDYRGIVCYLKEWSDLRKALKLTKIPHYTTLQKAQQRLLKKTHGIACKPLSSNLPQTKAC